MNEKNPKKTIGGIHANALVRPVTALLAILHVLIVGLILIINTSSGQLSAIMQRSGIVTQDATSLLAGSSLLSETSSGFVLSPTTRTGETNINPLMAYAGELAQDRRGDQVVERLRQYGLDDESLAAIELAASCANAMLDNQLHAISLINAVYPLPDIEPLNTIPLVELTEAERAMTDEEKRALATSLILDEDYSRNKQQVSQNVNACVDRLRATAEIQASRTGRRVTMLRQALWVVTLLIIVILILIFSTLYRQILSPLARFVRIIPTDNPLDENQGIHEVRLVASAYNEVLKRRDALDGILRSAAETDALTNLPNRYRFEQYLLESEESGYSIAVLLFDINYLKKTNDTQGHLAGDQLIRAAADCIAESFSNSESDNCFRFGGDEFAAVVKHCTPETIREMISRFEASEKQKNISVSIGCAYAEEIGSTTFKQLLDEADRKMYACKKLAHAQG